MIEINSFLKASLRNARYERSCAVVEYSPQRGLITTTLFKGSMDCSVVNSTVRVESVEVVPDIVLSGLSIVTNVALHVMGDYNTSSDVTSASSKPWVPALVAGDNIFWFSNNWTDQNAQWSYSNQIPISFCSPGVSNPALTGSCMACSLLLSALDFVYDEGGKMAERNVIEEVLVGLDFSKYSRTVLAQARLLADIFGARLRAVYVQPVMIQADLMGGVYSFFPSFDPEQVKGEMIRFYRLGSDSDMTISVYEGEPADVLLRLAKRGSKTLLVVGHKGQSSVSKFLLGSVAERVALRARCPVWVHRGAGTVHLKNFLLPHDLTRAAQKTVDWTSRLSRQSKGKLQIMHVETELFPLMDFKTYAKLAKERRSATQRIAAKLRKLNPRLPIQVVKGDPVLRLLEASRRTDVVVMSPHRHEEWLHGFGKVTAKVLRSSHAPLIVRH